MRLKYILVTMTCLFITISSISVKAQTTTDVVDTISTSLQNLRSLPTVISNISTPQIEDPEWLLAITVVTYDVMTKGSITADFAEFKYQANQTLNDSRGWAGLGVKFQEVANGGSFTLVLSEASQVPSFAPTVCSDYWSCQVGRYVIINQDRWLGASDAWNQANGALRDYRNMVVTHETGHWLGHGHLSCGGTGQLAPIMQQQSISLQGCNFNPWPLDSELWSSRLGI